jgi:hypothetical protein
MAAADSEKAMKPAITALINKLSLFMVNTLPEFMPLAQRFVSDSMTKDNRTITKMDVIDNVYITIVHAYG